jgi:phosphoglycolate phosphatase
VVVLFDIDGTLIDGGGAGRRAFEKAAASVLGRPDAFSHLRFDGLTDRFIARAALELVRVSGQATEPEISGLIDAYLANLEAEVRGAERYRVLPGVVELLDQLRKARCLVGLCTGNVRSGAQTKLARGRLNEHFSFGGFGDDGEARHEVVQAALRRASALAGHDVDPREAWVVGDTPKDLEGGRACGAKVLLVATGRHTLVDLAPLGADACVGSLADPLAAQRLLA